MDEKPHFFHTEKAEETRNTEIIPLIDSASDWHQTKKQVKQCGRVAPVDAEDQKRRNKRGREVLGIEAGEGGRSGRKDKKLGQIREEAPQGDESGRHEKRQEEVCCLVWLVVY